MKVELIYDADCPNLVAARQALFGAFAKARMAAHWEEWERSAASSPSYAKRFGSPTILIDDRDAAGADPDAGEPSCRLYRADDGRLTRAPSVDQLCSALLAAGLPKRRGMRSFAASVPAIGAALLPKLTCPLCWPAYTAALGALGLGFVDYTPYLLPATLAFLVLAVGSLALVARRRGRWIPLLLGVASTAIVLTGKFAMDSDWVTNSGIALLVAAIFLSTRTRSAQSPTCDQCDEKGVLPE